MLRKELKESRELPKLVTVLPNGPEASAPWVRTGRISRVKGLIWSRIGAVVSRKSFSVAAKAGVRACAWGISLVSAGPETSENRFELARPALQARSLAGNSRRDSLIAACSLAKGALKWSAGRPGWAHLYQGSSELHCRLEAFSSQRPGRTFCAIWKSRPSFEVQQQNLKSNHHAFVMTSQTWRDAFRQLTRTKSSRSFAVFG